MSATGDTLDSVGLRSDSLQHGAAHLHDSEPEIEILARRALGMAMNALSSGAHVTALAAHEPSLVRHAKELLARRVPAGPELALALDLLDGAAVRSNAAPTVATTA